MLKPGGNVLVVQYVDTPTEQVWRKRWQAIAKLSLNMNTKADDS
jgi:hypothetical protein